MTAPEWTEERLAALEEAAKKATPDVVVTPMDGMAVSPRDGYFLRSTDADGVQTDVAHVRACPTLVFGELEANAHLFASARPSVLGLVAEVRRLTEENADLRVKLEATGALGRFMSSKT